MSTGSHLSNMHLHHHRDDGVGEKILENSPTLHFYYGFIMLDFQGLPIVSEYLTLDLTCRSSSLRIIGCNARRYLQGKAKVSKVFGKINPTAGWGLSTNSFIKGRRKIPRQALFTLQ